MKTQQNKAIAKDAALTGLPTLDPNNEPTKAQRLKWQREYLAQQGSALKLVNVLRHHVTGAIERGEAEPIIEQTATQPTHSMLPWRISDNRLAIIGRTHSDTVIFSSNGQSMINGEANAAYIVRACNNAERLAEALRAWEYAGNEGGISMVDWFEVAREKTREALAQWEAGK